MAIRDIPTYACVKPDEGENFGYNAYQDEPVTSPIPDISKKDIEFPFAQASDNRRYKVERIACAATLGRTTQNVHIIYDNGLKAIISDVEHKANLQILPSRTSERPSLIGLVNPQDLDEQY